MLAFLLVILWLQIATNAIPMGKIKQMSENCEICQIDINGPRYYNTVIEHLFDDLKRQVL